MNNKLANPAPLGLMGFGMTTVLLNIHNAGFFPISSMILAMGIFYGGMAQIFAGIMEFKKEILSEQPLSHLMGFSGFLWLLCWFFQRSAGQHQLHQHF